MVLLMKSPGRWRRLGPRVVHLRKIQRVNKAKLKRSWLTVLDEVQDYSREMVSLKDVEACLIITLFCPEQQQKPTHAPIYSSQEIRRKELGNCSPVFRKKVGRLLGNLPDVKPTLFLGFSVPQKSTQFHNNSIFVNRPNIHASE